MRVIEMDKLIAEKIMGWALTEEPSPVWVAKDSGAPQYTENEWSPTSITDQAILASEYVSCKQKQLIWSTDSGLWSFIFSFDGDILGYGSNESLSLAICEGLIACVNKGEYKKPIQEKRYIISFWNRVAQQNQIYQTLAVNEFRAGRNFYRKFDRKSYFECIHTIQEMRTTR